MPLPAVLAAKLSKRGLLSSKKQSDLVKKQNFKGLSTCPNKYNIYHECTYWCETHWKGVTTPDHKYVRNMHKLLVKYPLPNNWIEIFDKGVGRYYYWNMETDLVSWLPPKHPRSIKTLSAAKIREKRHHQQEVQKSKEQEKESSDRDSDPEERHSSRHSERRDRDRDRERDRDDKRYRKDEKYSRKRSKRDDILDPMDPASYSDIAPGTWSDGLENNRRADNTASGVLFQQRPYPSPGEVLASNSKEKKGK